MGDRERVLCGRAGLLLLRTRRAAGGHSPGLDPTQNRAAVGVGPIVGAGERRDVVALSAEVAPTHPLAVALAFAVTKLQPATERLPIGLRARLELGAGGAVAEIVALDLPTRWLSYLSKKSNIREKTLWDKGKLKRTVHRKIKGLADGHPAVFRGYCTALSRRKPGFDSRWGRQEARRIQENWLRCVRRLAEENGTRLDRPPHRLVSATRPATAQIDGDASEAVAAADREFRHRRQRPSRLSGGARRATWPGTAPAR